MVLGISLILGSVAYSRPDVAGLSLIGYSRQPHDPGAFPSRPEWVFGGVLEYMVGQLQFGHLNSYRHEAHTLRSRWQAKAHAPGLGFCP
eukprot:4074474-Prymnesium_polylepis.1